MRAPSEPSLTQKELQDIAERTLASLAELDAQEALRRFQPGRHTDQLAIDEPTGKHYRLMIYASPQPWDEAEIALTVSVTAEPRIVRRARRLKVVAEFWEGWRDAKRTSMVTKVLPLAGTNTREP